MNGSRAARRVCELMTVCRDDDTHRLISRCDHCETFHRGVTVCGFFSARYARFGVSFYIVRTCNDISKLSSTMPSELEEKHTDPEQSHVHTYLQNGGGVRPAVGMAVVLLCCYVVMWCCRLGEQCLKHEQTVRVCVCGIFMILLLTSDTHRCRLRLGVFIGAQLEWCHVMFMGSAG